MYYGLIDQYCNNIRHYRDLEFLIYSSWSASWTSSITDFQGIIVYGRDVCFYTAVSCHRSCTLSTFYLHHVGVTWSHCGDVPSTWAGAHKEGSFLLGKLCTIVVRRLTANFGGSRKGPSNGLKEGKRTYIEALPCVAVGPRHIFNS